MNYVAISPTVTQRMRATLCNRFPACFREKGEQKVPLAVGIRQQIFAAAPDLDRRVVCWALKDYVHGRRYQQNLVPGAPRLNLDGSVASTVTPHDAEYATRTLQRLAEKWERRDRKKNNAKPQV